MISRTPPHDPLHVTEDEPPIDRAIVKPEYVRYVACGLLGFIVQASLSAGDFTRMAIGVGVFVAFWFVWRQTGR